MVNYITEQRNVILRLHLQGSFQVVTFFSFKHCFGDIIPPEDCLFYHLWNYFISVNISEFFMITLLILYIHNKAIIFWF